MAEAPPLFVFPRILSVRVRYLTSDLGAHYSLTGRGADPSWNHKSQMSGRMTMSMIWVCTVNVPATNRPAQSWQ